MFFEVESRMFLTESGLFTGLIASILLFISDGLLSLFGALCRNLLLVGLEVLSEGVEGWPSPLALLRALTLKPEDEAFPNS